MQDRRLFLIETLALAVSGCALPHFFSRPAPFSDRDPCRLPPGASKDQVVQYVNRNIQGTSQTDGLTAWQATSVQLRIKGLPISIPAIIAVEAPRRFRLRVSHPIGGEVADIGSNADHFWFWIKDAPHPNVITASHDDLMLAQHRLNIPFHPDWLMEVLGVVPIDAREVTFRPRDPQSPIVDLVSEQLGPSGEMIQKVIRVDSCHGIVREHALYDRAGGIIASAALGDHRIDKDTGLVTPRVIRFDWPHMQQQLTLRFADMIINPTVSATVWQIPEKPGYPPLELAELLRQEDAHGMSPFAVMSPRQSPPLQPAHFQQWDETGRARSSDAAESFMSRSPASGPPSTYSAGASQSSSDRRRREPALWSWPFQRRN